MLLIKNKRKKKERKGEEDHHPLPTTKIQTMLLVKDLHPKKAYNHTEGHTKQHQHSTYPLPPHTPPPPNFFAHKRPGKEEERGRRKRRKGKRGNSNEIKSIKTPYHPPPFPSPSKIPPPSFTCKITSGAT